jgi:hypothetical protein
VEVAVQGWQFWNGKNAVTQGHYLRLPDLRAGSVEALVKGDKVAETVVFRFDLERSEPPRYFVEEILRGGVRTGESGLLAELHPVTTGTRPAVGGEGYRQSDGFVYDEDATFRGTARFAAQGRLQTGERGLWLQSRRFNVAIESGMAPGLAALLTDLANTTLSEQATYFLDLRETFPMREGTDPGRRAVSREIGLARLDGVALGKFYFTNVADPGSSATASR